MTPRFPLPAELRVAGPEPPLYGRVCSSCGHLEISEDPLVFTSWRECPSCTVRRSRDA